MRRAVIAAAIVAFPLVARAQTDSLPGGMVSGSVYDSVAMHAVAGAMVQLVSKSSPASQLYSATSDAKGRYEVRNVPPGSYLIGFHHVGLDSLTLDSPLATVEVRSGERSRADLAVPSPARIIASLCRVSPSDSSGAILGFVRDARTSSPVDSGAVVAHWYDLFISKAGFSSVDRRATATVHDDGSFVLCGLPAGGEAVVVGMRGADSTGAVSLAIPSHGLLRRDLHIGGRVRVRGVVSSDKGLVANAEVMLGGIDTPVSTDSTGAFRIDSARAGTQTLQARALGFVPERVNLTLAADRDTTLAVRLTSVKKMMDTIQIVARRAYWADRGGFAGRKKRGFGTFFDDEYIQRRRPWDVLQLLQAAPSLRVTNSGFTKRVVMRGVGGDCEPALYIDRMKMASGMLADLAWIVPIDEVGGVEVYRSGSGPAEFSNPDGCGTIVIWTRPRPARK